MQKHKDRVLSCFYYDKTMMHRKQADSEFKTIRKTKSNFNVTSSLDALKCYEYKKDVKRKLNLNKNNYSSFREKFHFKTESELPNEYRSNWQNIRKDMYPKSKPIVSYTFNPRVHDNDCKADEKGHSSISSKSKRLRKKRVSVATEDTIPITPSAGIKTEERQSTKSKSKKRSKLRNPSKKKSSKSDGKRKKRKRQSTLILQPQFPSDDLSFEEDFNEFPLSKDCVSGAGPALIDDTEKDNNSYENHEISIEQLYNDCSTLTISKYGENHDDDKYMDTDDTPHTIKDFFSTPIFVNPSPPEEVILNALVAQSNQEKLINHEESNNGNSSNISKTNRETINLTISPNVKKTIPQKSTSLKEPIDSDCNDPDFTQKLLKLPKENRATSKNEKTSNDGSRCCQSRTAAYSNKDTANISHRKARLKTRSISSISPQRKESNDVENSDNHPKGQRGDRHSMYSGSPSDSSKNGKLSIHDKHFARTASKNMSEREERYSLRSTQSSRRRLSPRSPYFSPSSGYNSGTAVHTASPPYRSVSFLNTDSLSPEQRGKGSKNRGDASFGKYSKTDNYNELINQDLLSTSAELGDLRIIDENYDYSSSPNRISLNERISLVLNENDYQQQTNAQAAPILGGNIGGGYPLSYYCYSEYNMYANECMNPPAGYQNIGNYGNEYLNTDNLSSYSRMSVLDSLNNYSYNQQFLNHPESMQLHQQQQQHQHQETLLTNSNNYKILQHDNKTGKSSTFAIQKGNVLEIVPAPVVPKLGPESRTQSIISKEPNPSQCCEDIKPTMDEGVAVSVKTETEKCKKPRCRTPVEDNIPWQDEVAKRHIMSAVMRLNKEENGSPRGILITKKTTHREKKKVLFADGIPPGKGSSASEDDEYVNVRTVRKRSKKKTRRGENKENENLLQDGAAGVNNIEIKIDQELENAPPPPPPPGSPPACLLQPRPNRPPSPPQLLYFHYDPVVNSMYISQSAIGIPPRLLNKNNPAPVPPMVPQAQQQNVTKSPNNFISQINNSGGGSDGNTAQNNHSIRPNSPGLSNSGHTPLSSTNNPNQDQDQQPIAKTDKSDLMALPQPTTGPGNSFSETQLSNLDNGGRQDINELSPTLIEASSSPHHATQNLTSERLSGNSETNIANHHPPSLLLDVGSGGNNIINTNNGNSSSSVMLCSSSQFPPPNPELNFNTQSRLMANSPSTCGIKPEQFCIPPSVPENINPSSLVASHNPNNFHNGRNLQLLRTTSSALPNTNRPAHFRTNVQYNLPPPNQSQSLDNCHLQQHFSQLGHGQQTPNHSYHNQDTQFAENSVKFYPSFSPNNHHLFQYNYCGAENVGGGGQYNYKYNHRRNTIEFGNHYQCFNIGPGHQYSKKNARTVRCPTFGMVGGVKIQPNVNPGGSGRLLATIPLFNAKDFSRQFNANGSKCSNYLVPPHVGPNLCNAANINVVPPYNMGQQQVRPPPPHSQSVNSTGPTSSYYHSSQVANFSVGSPIQTPLQSAGGVHQLFL